MFDVTDLDSVGLMVRGLDGVAAEDRDAWSGPARTDRAVELVRLGERMRIEVWRAIGDADRDAAWQVDGYLSAPTWLADKTDVSAMTARVLVRAARLVRDPERVGKAVAGGDITPTHVESLARATRHREDLFVEHEDALVDAAATLRPADFEEVARRWRLLADQELSCREANVQHERRRLHLSPTLGGTVMIDGELDPEAGAVVMKAFESMDRPDPVHGELPPRRLSQRYADHFVDMARLILGGGEPSRPPKVAVEVVIDAATWLGEPAPLAEVRCDVAGIGPVPKVTMDRLLCDPLLGRAVMTESAVLDLGVRTPVVSASLRRAVKLRDRHCAFPGCDRRPGWCDVHHVVPVEEHGPTEEANLVLLCRRHHVVMHEGGWRMTRTRDGTVTFTPP
jgi:hypothetical protein